MKAMSWGGALRVGTMISGAWLSAGCSFSLAATDGTIFRGETRIQPALMASGVHDLPCAIDKLHIEPMEGELSAVSGCGWRVVYRVPGDITGRVELVSR